MKDRIWIFKTQKEADDFIEANLDPIKTHTCSKCRTPKPPAEFHRNRTKPGGLSHYCKVCTKQRDRDYWAAHPEAVIRDLKQTRKWKLDNPAGNKKHAKTYRDSHPDRNHGIRNRIKDNARHRQERANLSDRYIIDKLTQRTTLTAADITPELIEAKRIQLKIERALNAKRNGHTNEPE